MITMQVLRRRRGMPAALKVLITVVLLAAGSLGVAYVWQNSGEQIFFFGPPASESTAAPLQSEPDVEPEPEFSQLTAQNQDVGAFSTPAATSAETSVSGKTDEESGEDASSEADNADYAREALEKAVPSSAAVDYSYFDDAIFFGDSISTGIPLYMKTVVPNAEVIAYQGVSPGGAATAECIDVNGSKMTMLEAAKLKGERKKVYIMLGANALDSNEEAFMDGYRDFAQAVKEQYPSALIYIQSMLPVTSTVNQVYSSPNINNGRIEEFNAKIRDMAVSMGIYYVDVAQCMVNEDGFLPDEASPVDGMHLNPEYYYKWFDYLRSHTVPDNN